MARPRKIKEEAIETAQGFTEEKHGAYTIRKPFEKYVVYLGNSVVYAADTVEKAREYVALIMKK